MRIVGMLAIVVMVVASFSQTGPQVSKDSLSDRARKGDDSALSEMEKAGDVQDLRLLLRDA